MKQILTSFAAANLTPLLKKKSPLITIGGVPSSARAFVIAALCETFSALNSDRDSRGKSKGESKARGQSLLVVVANNQDAESLASEAELFVAAERIAYLPGFESIPYDFAAVAPDLAEQRLRQLYRILSGEPLLVFTSTEALMRRPPPPERLSRQALHLKRGGSYEQRELLGSLTALGYERVTLVELPGHFTLKGSLLDIYPLNEERPLRADFFGDELETLRSFDPESQKSIGDRDELLLLPAGELVLSAEESQQLFAIYDDTATYPAKLRRPPWLDELRNLSGSVALRTHPGVDELYARLFAAASLFDYFAVEPQIVVADPVGFEERREQILREYRELYERESLERIALPPEELLEIDPLSARMPRIELSESVAVDGELLLHRPEPFAGRSKEVRERAREILHAGGRLLVTSPYPAQLHRIAGLFRHEEDLTCRVIEDTPKEPVHFTASNSTLPELLLVAGGLRSGFQFPDSSLAVWSDADIFGRSYKRRGKFKRHGSSPIDSFLDLKEGDYVVHITHGVGRFLGLERVKAAGKERDFLVVEYRDEDRLFVPLDQISMVQRYVAATESPQLDHLGRASFKKVRERVEQRIEEFADELIELYATRMAKKGYAFPADTAWQDEFESEFPYEETPDQLAAIDAMKRDMESERPMDRLVCGDVGYGKTEVAIRGAFKAVMGGRQVVVVAPTTILALQHYRNFDERFTNYPIRVDWISRFRSRKEINEVKRKLAAGEIDVIIGTHALLAKDIKLRSPGLLIIDEEQRFGVNHKEAIKKIKSQVDVLTLSATPIPRTLHMSLVGIRDLSIIRTPPLDRLPVRTYVLEDSDAILREAIQREVERDGQLFYLHNRVETIDMAAARLDQLIPGIRYAVLHGQMDDDEIEDVLLDFMKRKYEVLVTTTIIESGIDMPNVNTLIIDRADTFGLSQLYQIRGRVGRAARQAYAYLFYPAGRSLTEEAQKRLNTIMEYQDLGSGFKVAMRDLEIRGAGNVLGREQSGDIMEVGFEMYVKLLEEAVKRKRGEKLDLEIRTTITLNTDFFIPEEYIADVRQRIEFYKRYEAARLGEEVDSIHSEMVDRFGEPPEQALTFVYVEKIRTLASLAGFASVVQEEKGRVRFRASEEFRVPSQHLVGVLQKGVGLTVMPGSRDTLFFMPQSGEKAAVNERLGEMVAMLELVVEPLIAVLREKEG